jgi:hypothetical protein
MGQKQNTKGQHLSPTNKKSRFQSLWKRLFLFIPPSKGYSTIIIFLVAVCSSASRV